MKKVRADLTGQRFGRLVVIKYDHTNKFKNAVWECRCDCGQTSYVITASLKSGNTMSCGCMHNEQLSEMRTKHGESHNRLHTVWQGMIQRCGNPNHGHFKSYGGRGIKVCDDWRNNYASFRDWALATGYSPDAKRGACTIDRIDVDGDYCPENCRWVSNAEQQRNKRNRIQGVPVNE